MTSNDTTNGHSSHISNSAFNHTVPLLINGQEVTTTTTFDVTSPVTNKVIWKSSAASKEDAIKMVEAAQVAFPAWSKTKPSVRRDILLKASDIFARRGEEAAEYMEIETGSTKSYSMGFNVPASVEQLRDVAGRIVTSTGYLPVCGEEGKSAMIVKEPYGVIFGIAPWNAPYILGFRAISYALAAGNTCVLKGPEFSPRCFWLIGQVFREAGLPDGCLNILFHHPTSASLITTTIISHPSVKKINYTGSTAIGSLIASTCGQHLKPCLLELGGKAPAIVLADADLPLAARACLIGAFVHAGQVCMSTERILVHESISERFEEVLKGVMEEMYGAQQQPLILIDKTGIAKNRELVKQAVDKGAKVVAGDLEAREESETRMRPIIISHVDQSMDLYYTESFGPTVALFTFKTEDEAIAVANDTEYGLSSAVFTEDLAAGLRVARGIETGAVHINNMSVHDEPNLPHGGAKKSGFGRFNGSAGLEEFQRTKTITWRD